MAELEKRLRSRGTDSSARSRLALSALKRNMPQRTFYDYIIINDDADKAAKRIFGDYNRRILQI